jgi:nucleoside-diphosphate-sugar epimerase
MARPLEELSSAITPATYLLHFAYLTRDRAALDPERYVAANVGITARVVHAVSAAPAGVLVASSGAVYGGDDGLAHDLVRDPYGTLKHLDELAISQAARRAGTACAMARIFSLGGREMTKPRLYALGDFVLNALAGEPIRIRSAGPVIRSYAADTDVVALGLAALVDPPPGGETTFDTGGTEIEIGDLALLVRDLVGSPDLVVDRPSGGEPGEDRYVSRGSEMEALARLHSLRLASLGEIILATAEGLRSSAT